MQPNEPNEPKEPKESKRLKGHKELKWSKEPHESTGRTELKKPR
jgi:hypothetical protein